MTPISDNESASQAKYALELALLKSAEWQLWAGEVLLTTLCPQAPDGHEFKVEWGKLSFAWWNGEIAQNWRVTSYEIQAAEIQLRVTRSFGRDLTTLTLRDLARTHEKPSQISLDLTQQRQLYARTLLHLLNRHFLNAHTRVGASRGRIGAAPYPRLRLRCGNENILAIGVSAVESQREIDGIVAAGLLWLADANNLHKRIDRLCFCLPNERSQTVLERLSLLKRRLFGARVECLEVDEGEEKLRPLVLATQTELLNFHSRELRWPTALKTNDVWRARILGLAPGVIETQQRPSSNGTRDEESFSIHGLEFARVHGPGLRRISFGVAGLPEGFNFPAQTFLREENFSQLEYLVNQLLCYRSAHTPDRRHPFYRLRAEAWLESLLRRDLRALDATLNERFVYSQIPAWRAEERSVLDLLTVNHAGRLVVIEIKASEDAQLPFQGLDYWLRVEQARVRGEFTQRGLFADVELADQPPLLYWVAPRLRFHRSFTTLAQCLAPEIEAYRIGINTNWRAGVRVHTCERLNADGAANG